MPCLQLILLGGFEARIAPGAPLDIPARKTRALLAYLALPSGRAHSRDKLVGLLWSDRGDEQAHNSLRQALAELGRVLTSVDPPPLIKARDSLALDPKGVEVDALSFERLATSENIADLRRAVELYPGDLLEGFGVRDPAFEDWLRNERQRYRELAIAVLKKLLRHESGTSALAAARRLVALAPLLEEGYRVLMRLHAEAGEIGAAVRQYETCRETLKRELGIEPSEETEALQLRIRQKGPRLREGSAIEASFPEPNISSRAEPPRQSKPSIAVLRFVNMSGDSEQDYFTDGITEEIITELSRFRSLFVIAPKSSFKYRSQSIDVKQIGLQLGVQYVVEGSIRKTGNRIRISAQLVDALTGNHLWAERFDRHFGDVFAIQDEVTRVIVSMLAVRLEDDRLATSRRKPPESMQAYDYWLRGRNCLDLWTKQGNSDAIALFEQAIEADPEYARAHAGLALACEWAHYYTAWGDGDPSLSERAESSSLKSVKLDPTDCQPHVTLGWIYNQRDAFESSRRHIDLAESLNPNDADMLINRAMILSFQGEADAALSSAHSAIRLNPHHPDYYLAYLGACYIGARRFDEASALVEEFPGTFPEWYTGLAVICQQLGRLPEARRYIDKFVSEFPSHWLGQPSATFLVKQVFHYKRQEDADFCCEALVRAGLPE